MFTVPVPGYRYCTVRDEKNASEGSTHSILVYRLRWEDGKMREKERLRPAVRERRGTACRRSPLASARLLLWFAPLLAARAPAAAGTWNRRAVTCEDGFLSRWDRGNCVRGASARIWRQDVHTGLPTGGGEEGLCDASKTPPGALTCEARVEQWDAPHVLLEPAGAVVASRESHFSVVPTLVVFLPGTGTRPQEYSRLLSAAQRAGHYVVGLSYLSQPIAVSQFNAWCSAGLEQRSGPECNRRAHASMLFGVENTSFSGSHLGDEQGLWDVGAADSVEALLASVLSSVAWGRLFTQKGGGILWSRMIVSGHSQGAGHAAFWAQSRPVLGASLLSGPQDTPSQALSWLRRMPPALDTWWRVLLSAHEECGPFPLHRRSFCEPNSLIMNLAQRRVLPVSNWTGSGGARFHGPGGSGTIVSYAEPSAGCRYSRAYHCSTALDQCAPLDTTDIEALWEDMFSITGEEHPQRYSG